MVRNGTLQQISSKSGGRCFHRRRTAIDTHHDRRIMALGFGLWSIRIGTRSLCTDRLCTRGFYTCCF